MFLIGYMLPWVKNWHVKTVFWIYSYLQVFCTCTKSFKISHNLTQVKMFFRIAKSQQKTCEYKLIIFKYKLVNCSLGWVREMWSANLRTSLHLSKAMITWLRSEDFCRNSVENENFRNGIEKKSATDRASDNVDQKFSTDADADADGGSARYESFQSRPMSFPGLSSV